MKRISLGTCILALVVSSQGWGTTFEPLGLRNFCRQSAVGFGQGYHSKPVPPNLRPHYQRVHQPGPWPVVLPPAYPDSPYAPTATSDAMRRFGTMTPASRSYGSDMLMPEIWSPLSQPYRELPQPANPPRNETRFVPGPNFPTADVGVPSTTGQNVWQQPLRPVAPRASAPPQLSLDPVSPRDSRFPSETMPKAVADLEEKAEAEPFAAEPAEPMRREPAVVSREPALSVPDAPHAPWDEWDEHEDQPEVMETPDWLSADEFSDEVPPPPEVAESPTADPHDFQPVPDDDLSWNVGDEDLQPIPLADLQGSEPAREVPSAVEPPKGFHPPPQAETSSPPAASVPLQASTLPAWSHAAPESRALPPTRILPFGQPRVWW